MQVRKANRVVLAAAAAVVVTGLVQSASAQNWLNPNFYHYVVSDGDDTVRVYSGTWTTPTFSYAIPLTTGQTQYGITWNYDNGAFYVLENNFIQTFWDGGSSAWIKGPRWDIGSQGFDVAYSRIGGGELYVTKRDSNIYVYNAQTGAMKRTMAISGASSLHGIGVDWYRTINSNNSDSTMLTVGDWGKSVGGYRISQTNGSFGTSWFTAGAGGLNYTYNGYGYMTSPGRDSNISSLWWFYSEGSGVWTTGSMFGYEPGEKWDWAWTDSTMGYMMSQWDANRVSWYNNSQSSPSRYTTASVNQPRGVFYKHPSMGGGSVTAPTPNGLVSAGWDMGNMLSQNTGAMLTTLWNALSAANQTTAFSTMTPTGQANLFTGFPTTQQVTFFGTLGSTVQTTLYNALAASVQTTLFPALASTLRSSLFPTLALTSQANSLNTVAVTERVSLFTPLVLTTQTTLFNTLAATGQVTLFPALASTTQATLFPTLALTSQTNALPTVTVPTQVTLFTPLALTTQTALFNSLASSTQNTLFNALGTTTQATLFGTLAETTQLSMFPNISEQAQVNVWSGISTSTQSTLFGTTSTISALNNVTITSSTTSGAGSSPTYTSVINGASLGVNAILTAMGSSAVTVRGGQGDGNAGEGTLTLAAPIDYDSLSSNQTLSLRATGALNMNAAIFDGNTGTARNLSLNLTARNALAIGTLPTSGDMNLNADILLTGGALTTRSFAGATLIHADADIIANGGINMQGASFTQTAGTGSITSSANTTGNISITATAGNVTLMNPIVAAGTGAGNVTIAAPATADITLGTVTAAGAMSVTASGAGSDVSFTGELSAGSLTVNATGAGVTFADDVASGAFTINGATGARVLGDDVVVTSTGTVNWTGGSFTQGAGAGSVSTTANTTGNISITATTGNVTMLNPISAAGTSAGNITVTAPAAAAITLGEVSGSGTVTVNGANTTAMGFTSTVDAGALVANATGSALTFDGDVTVGSMQVNGTTGTRVIGDDVVVDATGAITIAGASITQGAGAGSITATSNTTGNISITASGGNLTLLNPITASGTSAGNVTLGAPTGSSITLGEVNASGVMTVNGNGTAATSFTGAVTAGTLAVNATGAGTLAFDGAIEGGAMSVTKTGGTANYSTTVDLTGDFTMTGGAHVFAGTSGVTADSVTLANSSTSVTTAAPFTATTVSLAGGSFTTTSDLTATTVNLGASTGALNVNVGAGAVDIGTLNGSGGTSQIRSDATFGSLSLGSGGTFNVRNGAEVTVDTSLGTTGTVSVQTGSTLNVNSAVPGNSASITITGGTLFMAEEPSSGGSGVTFNSGTIHVGTDATYVTGGGMARFMGSSLGTGRTVMVDGVLSLDSPYTLSGGRLAVADIANSFNLTQSSGSLQLTASDFQVTAGGQFEELLTMNSGRVIELTDTSIGTVAADGTLVMSGGRFVVGAGVTMTNLGDVQFTNSNSRLHGDGQFVNQGIVSGTGRLDVSETLNDAGGIIRVSSGNYLRMNTNVVNLPGGRIEIQSASSDILNLQNSGLLTMSTSSVFVGKPTLRLGTALPSSNTGSIFISGEADIFGNLNNDSGGIVRIGGGGVVNFFDDIDNSGGTEFQVAGGSAAVFFSQFTLGTVTGDGTIVVMGTLIPRSNLGGGSSIEGDLTLGETSSAMFGVGDDAEFSSVSVSGDIQFGGSLVLQEAGYRHLGDTYELFSASTLNGQFDNVTLPEPGWGMNYELQITGNSVSAVVVPEPATLSALAGLVALGLRRRRH